MCGHVYCRRNFPVSVYLSTEDYGNIINTEGSFLIGYTGNFGSTGLLENMFLILILTGAV